MTPYYEDEKKVRNIFGLSGGKDSTALVGWAIHESGYPRDSLIFTFCDTGNEYDEVYSQIRAIDAYVQNHGCKPVVWLRATGDWVEKFAEFPLFLALCLWKGFFPSTKQRFCTDYLKIEPTRLFIQKLKSEGFDVVTHSGVRGSESKERSVMSEFGDNDVFGCKLRRPLLPLTISDVWRMHRKYGLPINPLYLCGWKRVGCRLCIHSNKPDVRRTVKQRSWVIAVYRKWENLVSSVAKTKTATWFHKNTVPEIQRTLNSVSKNGKKRKLASIDDVARWSLTLDGGTQAGFDFMFEEESFNIDDAHAPCKSGFCE